MPNSLEEETNGTEVKSLIKRLMELWKGEDKYDEPERREFARLVYPPTNRPKFKIREYDMEVIDISEKGIKLFKDEQIDIGQCVHGTAKLLCGKSIDITGKIIWQSEREVGLLTKPILRSVIIEEIRTVLRGQDSNKIK